MPRKKELTLESLERRVAALEKLSNKTGASLHFELPEDREGFQMAQDGSSMAVALFEIRQKMFRPARKHGFGDEYLDKINEANPELFEKLEEMFNQICEDYDVLKYT